MSHYKDIELELGIPPRSSDTERRRAQLAVCRNAKDASDARHLLDVLGLLDIDKRNPR